ncbi:MAG: hypothetical protein R3F17_16600 [Planctomycetota bacterium]
MGDLQHRLRIFFYRFEEQQFRYLLLKPSQGIESLWGPLHSALGLGEKLEGAIRRHARADLGVTTPGKVIDLQQPELWVLGDEEIVEWNFGYECNASIDRGLLRRHWADFRWLDFAQAYPSLGLEVDRQAILRLHAGLSAA